MPYVPVLLLGPGYGLKVVSYNKILESTPYVKVTVPNSVLGSTVCILKALLGSTACTINQYFLIKSPLRRDPIVKLRVKIQYFIQQKIM